MSIIQDALKKAQEERAKKNKREIPYHLTSVRKKPGIIVYAVIAVICAIAVIAYLYIPYFHKPKMAIKTVPAQTAAVTKSQGVIVVQSLPETQKPVNTVQQKENKGNVDQASRKVDEKSEVPITVKEKKELVAVRIGTARTQAFNSAPSARRKPALTKTSKENVVAELQKANENTEKRRSNENADVIYNEGLKEQQSGRIKEAKTIYRQVLAIQPNHVETLNNLGVIAIHEGKHRKRSFISKRYLNIRKVFESI
jgi:tetratricopeptide (TPR) repeat protein